MEKLNDLKLQLESVGVSGRDLVVTSGDGFLQIVDQMMPEQPVFVALSNENLVCWVDVVAVDAIKADSRGALADALLQAHRFTGLSTFSIENGFYRLNGNLSASSSYESFAKDIESLLTVAQDSLTLFLEFLD